VLLRPRATLHLLRVGQCRHPEWVTLRGGRLAPVDFPSFCGLLRHDEAGPILFDTGYAERFVSATAPFPERLYRWATPVRLPVEERLEAQLARHGLRLSDVTRVVVSHLHADHVAGLRDLPRARVTVMRREVESTLGRTGLDAVRRAFLPALLPEDFATRYEAVEDFPVVDLGPAFAPFERGFDLLGDGSLVGVPLPGHTAGQLGLLLRERGGRLVLLAADSCWSARAWREQRPPSPLARLLVDDWAQYRRTLAGVARLAAAHPDLAVLPSHCQASAAAWHARAAAQAAEPAHV
jgi:glyoxylase-like metal-dependent hydrolase (beta-lactamase superfamily II)